jgi:hypothetical protein
VQHDGSRDDRTGQAAAPDFVAAGHVHETHPTQRILQRARGRDSGHTDLKKLEVKREKAEVEL